MRALNLIVASLVLSGCASLQPNLITTQQAADAAYARGDFASAAADYAQLAKAVPNDAGIRYQLANSLARQGKTSEAIVAYRETLLRDPQHARAWHNLLQTQISEARSTADSLLRTLNHQQPHAPLARARAEALLMLNANAATAPRPQTSLSDEQISPAADATPEPQEP